MKPAFLARQLLSVLPLLRCPLCQEAFALPAHSLICSNGHCFDLSRKGYVNLAPAHRQSQETYNGALFASRARIMSDGFFEPVAGALCAMLGERFSDGPFTLLDAGCGEGYYARAISERFPGATVAGLDLSRDAVAQAARPPGRVHWFVADLKRLPVKNGAADVVLDVLTPADYAEFRRVLSPDGELLKVVPGKDYLAEIRAAVAGYLRGGGGYDNAAVLDRLRAHASVLSQTSVRAVFSLSPEQSRAFLRMTPMTFSVPEEALDSLSIPKITLDLCVLRCRMA